MINKYQISIILGFFVLSGVISYSALNFQNAKIDSNEVFADQMKEKTYFKDLQYYSFKENGDKLSLKASELTIIDSKDLKFTLPDGELYQNNDKIKFRSVKGEYIAKTSTLNLSGDVNIKTQDGSSHKADFIKYLGSEETFTANGNTISEVNNIQGQDKFKITAAHLKSNIAQKRILFEGDVKAKLIRNRSYEGSVSLEAHKMILNQLESHVFLEGDVSLERNRYYLHANKADIFLDNFNKSLKYYVLYDDIKLVEKLRLDDGTTTTRKAYSEKLEGYMREAKIVLSGAPRVEQGNDLIQGYQITLRENVELVEVDDSQTSFTIKRNNK